MPVILVVDMVEMVFKSISWGNPIVGVGVGVEVLSFGLLALVMEVKVVVVVVVLYGVLDLLDQGVSQHTIVVLMVTQNTIMVMVWGAMQEQTLGGEEEEEPMQ